jgi:hypothetical protein
LTLLLALLAAYAGLDSIRIAGFGMRNSHSSCSCCFYAIPALAVSHSISYALWAVLFLATIGIVGLTATFNKPVRDKTPDKVI